MEPAEKEKKKGGRLEAKRGGEIESERGVERLSDLRNAKRNRRGEGSKVKDQGREGGRSVKKNGEMILVGDWQSAVVDSSSKGR